MTLGVASKALEHAVSAASIKNKTADIFRERISTAFRGVANERLKFADDEAMSVSIGSHHPHASLARRDGHDRLSADGESLVRASLDRTKKRRNQVFL